MELVSKFTPINESRKSKEIIWKLSGKNSQPVITFQILTYSLFALILQYHFTLYIVYCRNRLLNTLRINSHRTSDCEHSVIANANMQIPPLIFSLLY